MLWDDIYRAAEEYLTRGDDKFFVKQLDDELVSEDAIERLAKNVRTTPYLIVSVGDPTATDYDSTYEVSAISVPVEVIVAVSDLSSQAKQIRRAREIAMRVKKLLQAQGYESEDESLSIFIWVGDEHLGTSRELTLYSVMFRVDTHTRI